MRLSFEHGTTSPLTLVTLTYIVSSILTHYPHCSSALRFFSRVEETQDTKEDAHHKLESNEENPLEYGVDISFPMHYKSVSTNYPWLPHNIDPENNPTPEKYKDMPIQPLGNRQTFYDDFMRGCRNYYGDRGSVCDDVEADRFDMSLNQPLSMVNYTDIGFKKIRAPERVYNLIREFYEANKHEEKKEQWFMGNTYTNHWEAPTYMVSLEDTSLRGAGDTIKQKLWNAARDTIQEWTGQELSQCSLYGVRVYKTGAVLSPHVDRLPLVTSAIINVAQDVDEPWPIEVIGHDQKAYNITMEPGDMVLYESHSVIHGRPYPLKGRFFANVFIHFEPTGHSLTHHGMNIKSDDVNQMYREASEKGFGGHENSYNDGLPTYLIKGSVWENNWRSDHPGEEWKAINSDSFTTGSTEAHQAAQIGDIETLTYLATHEKHKLSQKDMNGWEPIHEGARNGHKDVVELLVKHGVNANERTHFGKGGSPLFLAMDGFGQDHPVVKFLKGIGALNLGPEF